jgi:hypothetical protein
MFDVPRPHASRLSRSSPRLDLLHQTLLSNVSIHSRQIAQTYIDPFHVLIGRDPVPPSHLLALHRQRQILGHDIVHIDSLDAGLFQVGRKVCELGCGVELGAEGESSSPREDGGDRVGRCLLPFLVLTVVTGHLSGVLVSHRARHDR